MSKPYEIDVYKLLQYTKTAMNYANKITKSIDENEHEEVNWNSREPKALCVLKRNGYFFYFQFLLCF